MKRRRPFMRDEELNYWQSISDVMAALLLIILLVMMLFILYMTRVPDPDKVYEAHENDNPGEYLDDEWGDRYHSIHYVEHDGWDNTAGGGGGAGSGSSGNDYTGDGDDAGDYEFEEIGFSDMEGTEKAAIYVTVKDGETGMTIKEEGITFQLYDIRSRLQALSAYYPVREKYESFETTSSGSFYLPEKIALGSYRLTEISVPYGYDAAEDVRFSVEEAYEWEMPLAVTVELFPCRNVIRLQSIDAATQEKLSGAVYEVIAAENIVTADGTLRYKEGEVVDRIIPDQYGYGESQELFLGKYLLRQLIPSEYYAAALEDQEVIVDRKDQEASKTVQTLGQERTTLTLHLTDELHREYRIAEAVFNLSGSDGSVVEEIVTDRGGRLVLAELKKDTTYTLTQVGFPENYMEKAEPFTFYVTEDGRIEGQAKVIEEATNRKIRTSFVVKDVLLRNEISDASMALYDAEGELVYLWSSSAVAEELEGFAPGQYTLVVNGKENPLVIENTAEVQHFTCQVWSLTGILLTAGAAFVVLMGMFLGIRWIYRKLKKGGKPDEKKQKRE